MIQLTPVFPKVTFAAPSVAHPGTCRILFSGDDTVNWTNYSVVVGKSATEPSTYGDLTSPHHDTLVSEGNLSVRNNTFTAVVPIPSDAFAVGDHLWAAVDAHETPSSGDSLEGVVDLGVVVA